MRRWAHSATTGTALHEPNSTDNHKASFFNIRAYGQHTAACSTSI